MANRVDFPTGTAHKEPIMPTEDQDKPNAPNERPETKQPQLSDDELQQISGGSLAERKPEGWIE
jgi:bacteriocin-like protein